MLGFIASAIRRWAHIWMFCGPIGRCAEAAGGHERLDDREHGLGLSLGALQGADHQTEPALLGEQADGDLRVKSAAPSNYPGSPEPVPGASLEHSVVTSKSGRLARPARPACAADSSCQNASSVREDVSPIACSETCVIVGFSGVPGRSSMRPSTSFTTPTRCFPLSYELTDELRIVDLVEPQKSRQVFRRDAHKAGFNTNDFG